MANPLLQALMGDLGEDADYRAQDPFFMAGRSAGGWQYQPQTSSEALWMPALQGLLSGALTGYGKESSRQTAYDDARLSSLLQGKSLRPTGAEFGPLGAKDALVHDYTQEDAPEGWTPKIGKADMVFQALREEKRMEAEAKAEELREKFATEFGPEAIAGARDLAQAKKAGELSAEGGTGRLDLSAPMTEALSKSKSIIDETRHIAGLLDASGPSWIDFRTQKAFSGADKEGIAMLILNATDRLARSRSGAALNKEESKRLDRIMAGDLSATPAQVASLLRKLADAEARAVTSQLEFVNAAKRGTLEDLKSMLAGSGASSGPVPPGMQLFRNKKTGETKLVPK